jgi:hypothetical protein
MIAEARMRIKEKGRQTEVSEINRANYPEPANGRASSLYDL